MVSRSPTSNGSYTGWGSSTMFPFCATPIVSFSPASANYGGWTKGLGSCTGFAASPTSMAGYGSSRYEDRTNVRVLVVGDKGTGKSSLTFSISTGSFPVNVPEVIPPTRLPAHYCPNSVTVTIIDTSSSPEHRAELIAECRKADAVVLTYACNLPSTFDRLSTYWLPELRRFEVKAPVIVVGCKLDLLGKQEQLSQEEQVMPPIMQKFREIERCVKCSSTKGFGVAMVFNYAQAAVLYPTAPLFDQETQSLKPRCLRALKSIFILCDHDRDGALNDTELSNFQLRCFNAPLLPTEIEVVKKVVQEKMPEGVNDRGLTLNGFLCFHILAIKKGQLETTWSALREFGYDNDLKLRDDLLPVAFIRAPDQSVELTIEAVDFLKGMFSRFDIDNDRALQTLELDDLFSTAPESPWVEGPYKDAAENVLGGLSLEGFLSEWALMTFLDPVSSLANLMYIGYPADPASAFQITRRRRLDRKKKESRRNVFQCYVFGPKNAGKSALLNSLIGRAFSDRYEPTISEHFSTNVVDLPDGTKKTLIMREIPEDEVKKVLTDKGSLAACDVAVFVHDSSDENSWKKAADLLMEVATSKDDLERFPRALQYSTRVSQEMAIKKPIHVSMKLGEYNHVFQRIMSAAQHPHLSIPETEAGKKHKQYRWLVNRSLTFVSVGALVGLAAYWSYEARKVASRVVRISSAIKFGNGSLELTIDPDEVGPSLLQIARQIYDPSYRGSAAAALQNEEKELLMNMKS